MLRVTDSGLVRHRQPGTHHDVHKPRRSDAEAAVNYLTRYIADVAVDDPVTARWLSDQRDTLAIVVATAY